MDLNTNQRLSNIEHALFEAFAMNADMAKLANEELTYRISLYEEMFPEAPELPILRQKAVSLRQIEQRCWLLRDSIRD